MKAFIEVHIKEQTKKVTIDVTNIADLATYLNGCLDANIYPQPTDNLSDCVGSPQGENDGLDALDCDIKLIG